MKRTELVLICLVLCLPVVAFGAQGQPFQQLQDQINQINTKLQQGSSGSTATPTPAELSGTWSCSAMQAGELNNPWDPIDNAWISVDFLGIWQPGGYGFIQLNNVTLNFNDNGNGMLSLLTSAPNPFNPRYHNAVDTVCSIIGDCLMVKTSSSGVSIYRFVKWDNNNFILLHNLSFSPAGMISCSR